MAGLGLQSMRGCHQISRGQVLEYLSRTNYLFKRAENVKFYCFFLWNSAFLTPRRKGVGRGLLNLFYRINQRLSLIRRSLTESDPHHKF